MRDRRLISTLLLFVLMTGLLGLGRFALTQGNPSVVVLVPANGATNVKLNDSITATELYLPPGEPRGVDGGTLTSSTVYLCPNPCTGGGANKIDATLNTTGGNDAFTLTPRDLLLPMTQYQFVVTSGLKDLQGKSFEPYRAVFTTGTDDGSGSTTANFIKISTYNNPEFPEQTSDPKLRGKYASLAIGPDGRLYAALISATVDGTFYPGGIRIFKILPNGLLEFAHEITALSNRAVVGLEFDPASTPTNPILWVSSNEPLVYPAGSSNPGVFSSEILKLTVQNHNQPGETWTTKTMVTGLPRSKKDHLSNSFDLGPDGALYMMLGSQSAMGEQDSTWGNRAETALSGAVLRINITALNALDQLPYNVYTGSLALNHGQNDTYDPNAPGALVTLYATGIRNAYDLVWHTNGQLYVPTNGSAAGGKTPAYANNTACSKRANGQAYSGPTNIPALPSSGTIATQKDYLFRVVQGGYYGHPNPKRCEWVLNGGNSGTTPAGTLVSEYPEGINPDPNYRGISWDFGINKSPNGAIEYRSSVFSSALRGKILVVRYSGNDDILVLTPGGANKDIISQEAGIIGFTGFNNPLDLVENRSNGNIYLSEYQAETDFTVGRIMLLKPNANRRPVADQDNYVTQMNVALTVNAANGVLKNDSDVDGPNALVANLVTQPSNGTVTLNTNGSFTYTPNLGFKGTDVFTYRANDGALDSNLASVSILVQNPENQAPVAVNDSYSVNENVTLIVNVANGVLKNDTDPNGDALTAVLMVDDGPTNGTLTFNTDGSFMYVPNQAFKGADSFKYRADDGLGLRSPKATVTITVNPTNYSPIVVDETYYGVKNQPLTRDATKGVLVNDSDPNFDPLTATYKPASLSPNQGELVLNPDGSFTYNPKPDSLDTVTFQYYVSDPSGSQVIGTATLNILEEPEEFETLKNGTFEVRAGANPSYPKNWTATGLYNDLIRCNKPAKNKVFAFEGKCAFQFIGDPAPATGGNLMQLADTSQLELGDALELSAFVKATKIPKNAGLIKVKIRYADGTVQNYKLRFDKGTYDYKLFSQAIQLKADTAVNIIKVKVIYNARGTKGNYFVDGVSLWKEATGSIPPDELTNQPGEGDGSIPLPPAADMRGMN